MTVETAAASQRDEVESLPEPITSIQPGGGVCMRLELSWGRLRRWYLRTFRQGYVERMGRLRQGEPVGCPHEVLDPRDLKFYRNQTPCHWRPEDDPFAWRDRLPFARVGLAELLLIGGGLTLLAAVAAWWSWLLAVPPALAAGLVVWFFRDPPRRVPVEAGLIVAPADGRVVAIDRVEHDEFVGGPAVVIGIFLSVFNVHINRAPAAATVVGCQYRPGKFLNALRPASARENEQLSLQLVALENPQQRMIVRQIAGAIARRIVCWARPGETLERGAQFGMIKLGSRTELVVPDAGFRIDVALGARVDAGRTILGRYLVPPDEAGMDT